ncbi:hypothetical protein L3i20_v207120 [Paenibacillus sp. L3-i20]|nr:hypothetical protein L3i20_v207120 [Paenibacillus sp. L3-i20]
MRSGSVTASAVVGVSGNVYAVVDAYASIRASIESVGAVVNVRQKK